MIIKDKGDDVMFYAITIRDNLITGVHESMRPFRDNHFSANPSLSQDTIVSVAEVADLRVGYDIRCFEEDGTIKNLVWCIENGYMPMPEGYSIVEGELVNIKVPAEERPQTLEQYLQELMQSVRDEAKTLVESVKTEYQEETARLQTEAYDMAQQAKTEATELAAQQVAVAEAKVTALKPLINELIVDKPAEIILPLIPFMDEWKEGMQTAGKTVLHNGYPYKVVQTHNSTGNSTWTPEATPALFAPWHGVSRETALPWRKPTGAQDMYKKGEYMRFTDEKLYLCKQDTVYSPAEYLQAWEEAAE